MNITRDGICIRESTWGYIEGSRSRVSIQGSSGRGTWNRYDRTPVGSKDGPRQIRVVGSCERVLSSLHYGNYPLTHNPHNQTPPPTPPQLPPQYPIIPIPRPTLPSQLIRLPRIHHIRNFIGHLRRHHNHCLTHLHPPHQSATPPSIYALPPCTPPLPSAR